MPLGSTWALRIATIEEAPQSISTLPCAARSRWKQVLKRPPLPKASPEPRNCRRIALVNEGWGRLLQARDFVGERRAPHVAHLGVIVAPRAVHGDAVVPHHEVVGPPDMGVDELALRGVLGEVAQEGARLGHRPAFEAAGMAGEIE